MYSRSEAGSNVLLTIDIRLQEAAERALETRINEIRKLGEEVPRRLRRRRGVLPSS